MSVAGYVLAGGASRRFGADKARAIVSGQTMLQRIGALLQEVASPVALVAADESTYTDSRIPFVKDGWPGEGPLGGIVTALGTSAAANPAIHWNLIVSCDMPFLTREWLKFLIEHAQQSDAQAVVARSAHGVEPLCASWRTDAISLLQPAFEGGMRRVNDGLKLLRTEVLDEAVWKRFDSDGRLFWNMNTREDYEEARRILEFKT